MHNPEMQCPLYTAINLGGVYYYFMHGIRVEASWEYFTPIYALHHSSGIPLELGKSEFKRRNFEFVGDYHRGAFEVIRRNEWRFEMMWRKRQIRKNSPFVFGIFQFGTNLSG